MKRALVLGGGGSVGVAWEAGILAGLMDGGIDVRTADLTVGTSAGSVVGASVARGEDPRENLRRQREMQAPASAPARPEPDTQSLQAIWGPWGNDTTPMTPERAARIGELAIVARTMPEEDYIATFRAGNGEREQDWPERPLFITAVDCRSGERRVFERGGGVPVSLALCASCAVPGMFPPVTIEGHRYTDGGVHSMSNADLAGSISPDVVLIVSVFGAIDRGVHRLAAADLERESTALESAGATVRIIRFDEAALEASGGMNLMDSTKRAATASAAEAHGRRIAADLASWWRGS